MGLASSEFRVVFIDDGDKTRIEHHTTYQKSEDLEMSLKYGFKEGTLDAFERLDTFL